MKSTKYFTSLLALVIISMNISVQAQNSQNWCGTDQHAEEMKMNNPALIQQEQNFRQQVRAYIDSNPQTDKKASPYIIPVVFHCITDNGAGYISKADIDDQMLTINEDFQRMNSDASNTRSVFLPYAMNMNIEFRLAHLDPSGNCTEGIVRTDSPLSTDASDAVKSVSYWNSKKYFNIWVVNSIGGGGGGGGIILGYAQFPWSGINNTYGVIVDNDYVSRTDRTLTHEIGHCFGLLHTFQGGCGSSCQNSGDWICDTPPASTDTYGCSTSQNSCSNDATGPDPYGSNVVDQIENYMSYDACQNMFTLEQQASMESTLNSTNTSTGLDQLNTAANRAFTGVADPYTPAICAPIADFTYDKEYVCEGASVAFTDNSYNATPTAWNWTFTGGTPSSSSASNPTITYNTAGVYGVTHQPSTSVGSDNITKANIITVSSLTADYSGNLIDGFENVTQFNNDWWINNDGGQTWQNTTAAAATGNNSVRIRNYFTGNDGEIDELISPSYDLSSISPKTMKFKQAYVKKTSGNSDKLLISYSLDCGASWLLILPLTSGPLATGANYTGVFVPTAADWVERTVNLSSIGSATNVRFRFAFTSGGGNDIYMDDINVGGAVGISDLRTIATFSVYPNPTSSSAQISFNLIRDVKNLSIKIRNAVGQEITNVINGESFEVGKYTLKIDEERKLSSGIYFVEFNADNNIKVKKLVVQ